MLWLARIGRTAILGLPTCGAYSKATAADLVLPRLLTGERPGPGLVAGLGHGGLLTRDQRFRFPPLRARARRTGRLTARSRCRFRRCPTRPTPPPRQPPPTGAAALATIEGIQEAFFARDYVCDRSLATATYLALQLARPLLLEGEAGVGKTELAKVLAASLGARLIRLQCYEGLDVNAAVYEWNYPRQMLEIRLLEARGEATIANAHDIFGPDFLIRRPLLQALEADPAEEPPVLLIDEIDRADEEFEAYLLEILSDFQVTVPEIGTIKADRPPRVILTSNRTREVHDALKRRCLYHWIDYPSAQKEFEIVSARVPEAPEQLAREVVGFVHRLREADLTKVPGHRRDARLGRRAPVARCPRARAGARRRDPRRRPQVRGGHPAGPWRDVAPVSRGGGRAALTRWP